jgi:hypothetical protein
LTEGWQLVLPVRSAPEVDHSLGVPSDFLVRDGLVGFAHLIDALDDAIRGRSACVWVVGPGGAGKTVLTAGVLHERFELPGTARVLWIDMARVPGHRDALAEDMLLALGKTSALMENVEEQWRIIRQECDRRATIVVLDSMERWSGGEPPQELFEYIRYPSVVVITSRRQSLRNTLHVGIEVEPLDRAAMGELLGLAAGRGVTEAEIGIVYDAIGGNPLGCVWVGGVLRNSSQDVAASLIDELQGLVGEGRLAGAELQAIFQWCMRSLNPVEDAKFRETRATQPLHCLQGVRRREVRVAKRHLVGLVAHELRDGAEVDARHNEPARERVPQVVPVKARNPRAPERGRNTRPMKFFAS